MSRIGLYLRHPSPVASLVALSFAHHHSASVDSDPRLDAEMTGVSCRRMNEVLAPGHPAGREGFPEKACRVGDAGRSCRCHSCVFSFGRAPSLDFWNPAVPQFGNLLLCEVEQTRSPPLILRTSASVVSADAVECLTAPQNPPSGTARIGRKKLVV